MFSPSILMIPYHHFFLDEFFYIFTGGAERPGNFRPNCDGKFLYIFLKWSDVESGEVEIAA